MAGSVAVELALLEKRFPEKGISQCGQLLSGIRRVKCLLHVCVLPIFPLSTDFFCARSSGGRSYEGRLFVMDRALLFVST